MLPMKEDLDFISQHVESKAINQITIGFSERIILERRLKKKKEIASCWLTFDSEMRIEFCCFLTRFASFVSLLT